ATALDAGVSALAPSGSSVTWTSGAAALAEGTYYWQALAADAAGNQSSWSATHSFTLDLTPPAAPTRFAGALVGGELVLSWTAPTGADPIGGYVLYINGVRSQSLDGATTQVDLGRPSADEPRVLSVAAVDTAGNVGLRSDPLVAVPNLIGLNLGEARAAVKQRGLVLGERHGPAGSLVTGQSPAPPAVAAPGSAVDVTLATPQRPQQPPPQAQPRKNPAAKRALSIVLVGQRNVSCKPTDRL